MEELKEDHFYKQTEKVSDTLVLVGNGAIQNGFLPLRQGLDKWIVGNAGVPPIVEQLRRQDSEAYHQLAIASYKFKFGRASVFKDWKSGACTAKQTEATGFHNTIKGFLGLRTALANEFLAMAGQLSVRWSPEVESLIGEDAAYSTTNWDTSLWNGL